MSSDHLQGRCHGHAAATADGCETQLIATLLHGMNQCYHNTTASRSHRMSQATAGAVHVRNLTIQTQFLLAGRILGGKGLDFLLN